MPDCISCNPEEHSLLFDKLIGIATSALLELECPLFNYPPSIRPSPTFVGRIDFDSRTCTTGVSGEQFVTVLTGSVDTGSSCFVYYNKERSELRLKYSSDFDFNGLFVYKLNVHAAISVEDDGVPVECR